MEFVFLVAKNKAATSITLNATPSQLQDFKLVNGGIGMEKRKDFDEKFTCNWPSGGQEWLMRSVCTLMR